MPATRRVASGPVTLALALALAAGAGVGSAVATPLPKDISALVGKPFSTVRAKLVADGWVPTETNLTTPLGEAERSRGEAGKFLTAGYPEIERCTGGGRNYCFLNYARRGKCVRVRTLGVLEPPDHDPKVHGVGDACPTKQKPREAQP